MRLSQESEPWSTVARTLTPPITSGVRYGEGNIVPILRLRPFEVCQKRHLGSDPFFAGVPKGRTGVENVGLASLPFGARDSSRAI